jgi:hypothetical protein
MINEGKCMNNQQGKRRAIEAIGGNMQNREIQNYNHRYHEALGNIIPADKYTGREEQIFKIRRFVKERTIRLRRKMNGYKIKSAGTLMVAPAS